MATDRGARPATPAGNRAFVVTPFARLARAHCASTMADAMIAASLAGSLFFTLPAGDARGPVLRYLVLTMLPFAVTSPLIGPMIDRMKGGHRLMVIASAAVRVLVCYFMIPQILGGSTIFFLLALCILVSQKAYSIGRSALVPTVVDSEDALVEANSKLSLISGVSSLVGVIPAAILLTLFDARFSVGLAMITYAVAAALALRIPRATVATESADETERLELRGSSIIMAGSAMGFIRMCVGFLTLLVAFDFRGGDRPAWQFGLVGGVSVLSQLAGAAAAPRIRAHTSEENLLTGVVGLLVAGSVLSFFVGDVFGAAVVGGCVGFAAGGGKLAFDSILQRDAPDANRGRAFAKFETRFQVTWVIGALVPVLPGVQLHVRGGFLLIFLVSGFALASYMVARGSHAHRSGSHQSAATARAVEIEERFSEVSEEVRERLSAGSRSVFRRMRPGRDERFEQGDQYDGYDDDDDEYDERDDRPGDGGYDVRWAGDPSFEPGPAPVDCGDRDRDLAGASRVAWRPPIDDEEPEVVFPWEPLDEPDDGPGSYLADVDPSVFNPFPWSPARPAAEPAVDGLALFDQDETTLVDPERTRVAPAPDPGRRLRSRDR